MAKTKPRVQGNATPRHGMVMERQRKIAYHKQMRCRSRRLSFLRYVCLYHSVILKQSYVFPARKSFELSKNSHARRETKKFACRLPSGQIFLSGRQWLMLWRQTSRISVQGELQAINSLKTMMYVEREKAVDVNHQPDTAPYAGKEYTHSTGLLHLKTISTHPSPGSAEAGR